MATRTTQAAARAHQVLLDVRRARAIARITAAARLAGAELDLSIDPTARVGRLDVRFAPGTSSRLHIGAHTTIDDAELRMGGGSVHVGEWCELRRGLRIMAGGELRLEGENIVSWGVVVHCDESVVLARQATFGEYVTIADSVHEHVEGRWHADHLHTAPVVVGADTWVGAKATITKGVTVGEHCIVAGGAVVTRDVPDRHLAAGVPATNRPIAPRPPA